MQLGTTCTLRQQQVTLTNDQIKTLPSTGITVVEAQGEDTVIVPVVCFAVFDTTAGAYTWDPQASLCLTFNESAQISDLVPVGAMGIDLVAGPYFLQFPVPHTTTPLDAETSDFAGENVLSAPSSGSFVSRGLNKRITIGDTFWGVADYTGGHPANTLTVTLLYVVYDVATHAFL